MLPTLCATLALALTLPQDPTPTASERPGDPPRVHWQRNLADALAVQQATGLPLLIVVNMDGEVFNDRFAGNVYKDPKFVELTRGYVCVVASPDQHTTRDYDALGNRVECPRFGGCTCSEHIQIEPELFRRWFDGKRNAPRHVGVSKEGTVLFDRYLDQSMQTAIDAIAKHRGTPPPDLGPTDDVEQLFRRRDALARSLLERRYRDGDAQRRADLLRRAADARNEPVDLLRIGIREADGTLCGLAAIALGKVGGQSALIDIEDALARIDDDAVRAALLVHLRELGRELPQAARLASHLEAAAEQLPAPWRNAWAAPAFAAGREGVEQALDRFEAGVKKRPDDGELRLGLATAQAAFALVLMDEGGSGIELWLQDAQRNLDRVTAEALQPEAKALAAVLAWYLGDADRAAKAAVEAMSKGASDRRPDPWLAATFFDVVLQTTAQAAFGRAQADPKASLRGELVRTESVLKAIGERQALQERGALAGASLLEFAGRRAEAQTLLAGLAERFPGSVAVHDRWRARLIVDLGAERMRHRYAKYVTDAKDRPTAQWFAGYAALVAGEQHTRDDRRIEAENAYGDAIERLLESAAGNPDYADTANHYAVLALAGRAAIRQLRDNLRAAVDDLVRAAQLRPDSLDENDGLDRKPRAIAERVERALRDAGQTELADRLQQAMR